MVTGITVEKQSYCKEHNYEFVWFCHDVEEVFLGHSVHKSEKTKCAIQYDARNGINNVKISNLKVEKMAGRKSNLVIVFDKYLKGEN